ncbi:restriction endonuclease subunit S [Hymenobacter sp. M29]|uniref:Restriction endonuclease subunit S n=1 Tax=Hymenobacter mellowenesis TaxID=3063995 RepID=A0ABT9A8W8_9BACT|nr:restriction endonuclease subunit S [Hymenobacter sp. M29]MDO7846283.1 restriction endonuclease subunit S [Hymenobacter sp. M29]
MSSNHTTLSEVADINPRADWKSVNQHSIVSFVPMAAVSDIDYRITAEQERPLEEVKKGFTYFQRGDVILAKITPCFENGKVALADIQHEYGFGSTEFHVIRAKEGVTHPRFLYYLLRQPSIILEGTKNMTGSGGQRRVPKVFLENLPLTLPPLDIQQRIADTLDTADALRRKDQELLRKYDDLAQSIFYEMFGDPVTNTQKWSVLKISDMIDFMTSGSRGWSAYYSEQGDLFIRINNVVKGKLVLDDVVYVNAPDNAEARRTRVQPGDVLVSITADLGRVAVIPEGIGEAFINQHLALLRFKQEFVPEYIAFYLSSSAGQAQIQRNNKGGVKAGLNFADILGIDILVPPKHLQQKFTDAIRGVDELAMLTKANIQTSMSLFESLLSASFTTN